MKKQKGFTLTELMICVAVVGILAAIAISSYTSYLARVQSTDIINVLSRYKAEIVEHVSVKNWCPMGVINDRIPYTYNLAFGGAGDIGGEKYTCMVMVITQSKGVGKINPAIADQVITLSGKFSGGGSIEWLCRSTIEQQYLPSSCVGSLSATDALSNIN